MKLYKEFFRYVIPSMLAFALSGLYGIADSFFLGNEMGDAALAAINVASPITAFVWVPGTGMGEAVQAMPFIESVGMGIFFEGLEKYWITFCLSN